MHDLRLVGVHDDGEHLLLADSDGNQYRLALDDRLRGAARPQGSAVTTAPARTMFHDLGHVRPAANRATPADETMRPREIQAMLRAGATIEQAAERSGWAAQKVERYAGPITAERAHVADLARGLALRGRGGFSDTTFDERVTGRLHARGVEVEQVEWDAWKGDAGRWSVVCRFAAGGRERTATWLFDPTDHTIGATDDEARWLGEDDQPGGPLPAAGRRRDEPVYDVEAEGGLGPVRVQRTGGGTKRATQVPATQQTEPDEPAGDPVDLVSAMRERAEGRRKSRRHPRSTAPAGPARRNDPADPPPDAQPQEALDVDSADAPPLGSHPRPDELDDADQVSGATTGAGEVGDKDSADEAVSEKPASPADEAPDHDPVTGTGRLFSDDSLGEPAPTPPGSTTPSTTPSTMPEEKPSGGAKRSSATPDNDKAAPSQDEEPPRRPSSARRGRPSVPSWDDIMFGSKGGSR